MEEDGLALAGRDPIAARLEGTAAGAINALPILRQPGAHLLEPLGLLGRDLPIGHRAHIQQQVPVAAGAADQHIQAGGERLHAVFVPTPRPLPAARNGHAGFPWPLVVIGTNALLWCIIVRLRGKELGIGVGRAKVESVVNDDAGLQVLHDLVGVRLVVERLVAVPVEPEQVNAPAVAQQLAHFGLHSSQEQRVAFGAEVGVTPVHWREIPADAHVLLPRRPGQLDADVTLKGAVGDVVITGLAVPEEEAVAVLGGEHHVFRAGGLR